MLPGAECPLTFVSPGDDLLCGRPAGYEVAVDGGAFERVHAAPVAAGETVRVTLRRAPKQVSVRAVDEQGNPGRPALVSRR